jgi:RHS repeat-associated protein
MNIMTGYIYDAEGRRVAKGSITSFVCDPTTNGFSAAVNETDYVLDREGHQVTEMGSDVNGTMAWAHTNVWAGGQLLATYSAILDPPCQQGGTNCQPNCLQTGQSCPDGALHFYFNDWLGTRRVQTDYAGIQEQDCSSLPFGDQLNCTQSIGGPTEHHFTGKERDSESGLDYFGARYYGSTMGRFMSPDPDNASAWAHPGDPQAWNAYSYGRNNPLTNVDPDGETYHVCDQNGQNCSDQSDAQFDQNRQNASANGERYSNGNITFADGTAAGSYKQTDVDLSPSSAAIVMGVGQMAGPALQAMNVGAVIATAEVAVPVIGIEMAGGAGEGIGNLLKSSSRRLPNLKGLSKDAARKALEQAGFKFKGLTEGGYEKWYAPDGSRVQIRPDGEVVRTDPKTDGYRPRIGPDGNRTDSHNTGETLQP